MTNSKVLNQNDVIGIPLGQIGINENTWPMIQLYDFSGPVVIQYFKAGTVQEKALTFASLGNFADINLDNTLYSPDSQVLVTVTDRALNIDPTDEDSWTFSTSGTSPAIVYQAFDENGQADADGTLGAQNIFGNLTTFMFEQNGRLSLNTNVLGQGEVVNLVDNADQQIIVGIAAHTHGILVSDFPGGSGRVERAGGAPEETQTSNSAGSGNAHNNLQPYITVHMFQRTA